MEGEVLSLIGGVPKRPISSRNSPQFSHKPRYRLTSESRLGPTEFQGAVVFYQPQMSLSAPDTTVGTGRTHRKAESQTDQQPFPTDPCAAKAVFLLQRSRATLADRR